MNIFKKIYNYIFEKEHEPWFLLVLLLGVLVVFGLIGWLCNPDAHLNIDWHALDFE